MRLTVLTSLLVALASCDSAVAPIDLDLSIPGTYTAEVTGTVGMPLAGRGSFDGRRLFFYTDPYRDEIRISFRTTSEPVAPETPAVGTHRIGGADASVAAVAGLHEAGRYGGFSSFHATSGELVILASDATRARGRFAFDAVDADGQTVRVAGQFTLERPLR